MRFAHSFWSEPLFKNKFNDYEKLLPVVLTDYAYSVACIKHHGHSIRLFADEEGAKLLSFIPYDEVIIIKNTKNWNVHFAAQIKFEALKRMDLDEALIDGDLFIRKPEAYKRIQSLNADFIYSFFEPVTFTVNSEANITRYQYMRNRMRQFRAKFVYPYELDKDIMADYNWTNTSFMKFNNQALKDEYIRQYEYYKDLLSGVNFEIGWPDIIIEQRHMTKLLATGYTSLPVVDNFPDDIANEFAIEIGFTHLGSGKIHVQNIVSDWLKELDFDLFDKTQKQIDTYMVRH